MQVGLFNFVAKFVTWSMFSQKDFYITLRSFLSIVFIQSCMFKSLFLISEGIWFWLSPTLLNYFFIMAETFTLYRTAFVANRILRNVCFKVRIKFLGNQSILMTKGQMCFKGPSYWKIIFLYQRGKHINIYDAFIYIIRKTLEFEY